MGYEELSNQNDKLRNKMNILVNDMNIGKEKEVIIKSKNVICPICQELIKMDIHDYNIFLYECKNGHEIDNILLNEFEDKQKINLSKIECDKCKKNKSQIFNNVFYKCNECKINLCPLCKGEHVKKGHRIINYDDQYYKCDEHNESFVEHCNDCNENLCFICQKIHYNHKRESYLELLPNIEEVQNKINNLKIEIDKFTKSISSIINKLMEIKKNIKS
jgi:uncharacterized protein CbrC (UPF0167 family)